MSLATEKTVQFCSSLKVLLTREEVEKAASELARTLDELKGIKEEQKAANDAYKGRIGSKEQDINRFTALVRDRYEFRSVDCLQRFDFERGIVEQIRCDTGEILESRTMRDHERQMNIADNGLDQTPE